MRKREAVLLQRSRFYYEKDTVVWMLISFSAKKAITVKSIIIDRSNLPAIRASSAVGQLTQRAGKKNSPIQQMYCCETIRIEGWWS